MVGTQVRRLTRPVESKSLKRRPDYDRIAATPLLRRHVRLCRLGDAAKLLVKDWQWSHPFAVVVQKRPRVSVPSSCLHGLCAIAPQVTEEETMSIFGSIVSAIFGGTKAAPSAAPTAPAATASAQPGPAATSGSAAATPATAAPKPMTREEVEAMIAKIASGKRHENYNWKQSIVDLMKLLDLDSSLSSRKQLAQELGYTGALDGSAEMNTWLHKQVMTKLMESGGVVPASLK
jgi:hypothetical protein